MLVIKLNASLQARVVHPLLQQLLPLARLPPPLLLLLHPQAALLQLQQLPQLPNPLLLLLLLLLVVTPLLLLQLHLAASCWALKHGLELTLT